MPRTHRCGELGRVHIDQTVNLTGWVHGRRDHGGIIFIDLRDRQGITQIVFDSEEDGSCHQQADQLRHEYVIEITGRVSLRPEGSENTHLATGEIEVRATTLRILNESKPLPFSIEDDVQTSESLRLKYRYLDFRRPRMNKLLELRHQISFQVRTFLHHRDFFEIETPILTKSTPEGARDYLVPSRVNPGDFLPFHNPHSYLNRYLWLEGPTGIFRWPAVFGMKI